MNLTKELSVFNRITFVEKDHRYLIDNERANCLSVTRAIKKFKPEFDKIGNATRIAKRTHQTTESVLADWDMNNLYSTTLGSMLHKYTENYYNNKRSNFEGSFEGLGFDEKQQITKTLPVLVQYFQNFYNDNACLLCVKNELVVGDLEDTKICGMVDLLSYNTKTDELEIIDFKTNKRMGRNPKYGNLFPPFDDMSQGEINEYTIQLNLYKYFVEKYTSLKISKLKLVWINAQNENYKLIELDTITDRITTMLLYLKRDALFEET